GDLLVVNTSATMPAALTARLPDGSEAPLHLSTQQPDGLWLVELRPPGAGKAEPGNRLELPGGAAARLLVPRGRLWLAELDLPPWLSLLDYLAQHGRAIRYSYVHQDWPIEAYRSVYATDPGSAEMPSAGRAFTAEIITALVARG